MVDTQKVIVKIDGDESGLNKSLKKASKDTDKFSSKLSGSASKANKSFASFSRAAIAGIAAIGTAVAATVARFAAFESEFNNVVTLLDESSFKTKTLTDGIKGLEQGILRLRATTGESFSNLNKGLFDLISAGISADDAIDTLEASIALAKAGATNTAVAVDGLTSAINAYNLSGEDATDVSEKFFTAQKFGKTTIAELSASFGQVGATASAFGVSLDEVLASVSSVTLAGVGTSEAFTGLKAALSNIAKPTKEASEEAERLGVAFDTVALKRLGLEGFFNSITQSAEFNDETFKKLFGSTEALNFALALGAEEGKAFKNTLDELGDATQRQTTFNNALAVKTEETSEKWKRFIGQVDTLVVKLGKELAPVAGKIIDFFSNQVDLINKSGGVLKTLNAVYVEFGFQAQKILINLTQLWNKLEIAIQRAKKAGIDATKSITSAVNNILDKIPFIEKPLQGAVESLEARSQEKGAEIAGFEAENQRLEGLKGGIREEADRRITGEEEELGGVQLEGGVEGAGIEGEEEEEDPLVSATAKLKEGIPLTEEEQEAVAAAKEEQDAIREEAERAARERRLAQLKEHEGKISDVEKKEMDKRLKDRETNFEKQLKILTDKNAAELDKTSAFFKASEDLTKAFGARSKKISRTLAIGESLIATGQAIAKANAKGFPQNIPLIAQAIATGSLALSTIKGAAAGGIVPGQDTGRDTTLMALRPEELVVPPQLVKPLMPSLKQVVDEEAEFGEAGGGTMQQNVVGEFSLKGSAGRIFELDIRRDQEAGII